MVIGYIFLQISCIGHIRTSVKNYENRLTLGKVVEIIQRVTFLLDHIVVPIVQCCIAATAEETILACKNAEKYAISTLIFWKFFWGHSPQTPMLGRG